MSMAVDAASNAADAAGAQTDEYFSELLSYSLDRLNKEPEQLQAQQDALQQELREAAVRDYGAFIAVAHGFEAVVGDLNSMSQHLSLLSFRLPQLSTACSSFNDSSQRVLHRHAAIHSLLNQHSTVVELLEAAQLMDACVKNGSYDEALDVHAAINKMATLHGDDCAVIRTLAHEASRVAAAMLQSLLQKLASNIQLPDCLRIVGYLRRIGIFNEQELRVQFLRCREQWLVSLIDELHKRGMAYDYLKRLTDIHRLHLFDIVMQFRAIFTDDTATVNGAANDVTVSRASVAFNGGSRAHSGGGGGGVLYSWAQARVQVYMAAFETHLPRITDGSSLASILEAAMYCGSSLARVGLDFRALLPAIVEDVVRNNFERNMDAAVQAFSAALDAHKWLSLPRATSGGASNKLRPLQSSDAADGGGSGGASDDISVLMEHSPLAVLCNMLLAAFNELRYVAPRGLARELARVQQNALERCSGVLLQYSVTRSLNDNETQLFHAACAMFVDVLVPHAAACLRTIFPAASIDVAAVCSRLQDIVSINADASNTTAARPYPLAAPHVAAH